MKRRLVAMAPLALALIIPTGCSENDSEGGDCSGRIRYDGALYRFSNAADNSLPLGKKLGTGEIVDCGGLNDAPAVKEVDVFSVKGVDPKVAILTDDAEWGDATYIEEGLADMGPSAWPSPLQRQ